MLIYSSENPCNKENKAPSTPIHNQLRRKVDDSIYKEVTKIPSSSMEPRAIVKSKSCLIPGAPAKAPIMEKDLPFAPKSIDFADEGMSCETKFSDNNPSLSSKHAWSAMSPCSDRKSSNGASLPILNGSNVTVDSPDPTSKFYAKSPPLTNYLGDVDSPDLEASYEMANLRSPGKSIAVNFLINRCHLHR